MANWTPDSFPGRAFRLSARYAPPPPGMQPPVLWGDENVVRERLGSGMNSMRTTRRLAVFKFAGSPARAAALFIEYFGPTKTTYARLDEAQQKAFAADFVQLFAESNISGNNQETITENEYLEVIATKA